MKLIKLELRDDFRSLKKGFVINFTNDKSSKFNPYCLVGLNGSGKSNILEILATIFYQLDLICLGFQPEIFEKYDTSETKPNSYLLEYFIGENRVRVVKEIGKRVNVYLKDDTPLSKVDIKKVLPAHIVAYSSGGNETLSLPFLKTKFIQYDEYHNSLIKKFPYSSPESRLVYLDSTFSQSIFLCNFLFQSNNILKIFDDVLGIKKTKRFSIVINKSHFELLSEEHLKSTKLELFQHIEKIQKNIENYLEEEDVEASDENSIRDTLLNCLSNIESRDTQIELTTNLESEIDKLIRCSTLSYEDKEKELLYLDFYVDDILKEAFKLHFGDAFGLFKLFQILIVLNSYHIKQEVKNDIYRKDSLYAKGKISQLPWNERIFRFKDFWIEKNDNVILSKSLSDGEHQFLHSIGLALLYKNTSSLFLLDEPETHFNPKWRANYISTLHKCFKDDTVFPEILITSHSPFIISDLEKENVLVFEKNKENNVVECHRPDFNTFGASVSEITEVLFNQTKSMGDSASDELEKTIDNIKTLEDYKKAKIKLNNFGESIEKFDILNKLNKMKRKMNL
jgi:restriction system-associated AAA family ATPase